jgi:acetyl-CoA carboxylase biotin carboxyl carrier protein
MKLEEIKEIIKNLEGGKIKKFSLKNGDFEMQIEKESEGSKAASFASYLPPPFHAHTPSSPARHHYHPSESEHKHEGVLPQIGTFISSPMVGTFYSAAAPGQPTFVKVGDEVEESTVVCVIEAMKVMNEVKAGTRGTVKEILVENAQPVEFGTNLFTIE